ncbi:MAG: hypothetical protein IPJ06_15060 [Saprospiraceae bacterium]|nr:hypothetical protein [Saprospiraceae bacterium]
MANQNIPDHELPVVLSILGRDYGGLIDTEEVLDRLGISEETFDFLQKDVDLWSKTINDKEYFRSDEIDHLFEL